MGQEEMLKVEDVATRLDVNPYTVRRWLRTGRLRGVRLAGRAGYRIPLSEYERFVRDEMERRDT